MEQLHPSAMATGCLPAAPQAFAGLPAYSGDLIPPEQYRTTEAMKPFVQRGLCQASVPACCEYACLKCYLSKYAMTTGKTPPKLSFCATYQDAVGGDFSAGDVPPHAVAILAGKGAYPASDELPVWFGSPRRVPAAAEASRHLYRADEWEKCGSAAEVISAVLNGDPVAFCVEWFTSDRSPGPEGELPVQGDYAVGGHALFGWGLLLGYHLSPSGVGVRFNNHHGDKETPAITDEHGRQFLIGVWGDDGDGVMPIERIIRGFAIYGPAAALRSVYVPDSAFSDVPTPKFKDAA